MMDNKSTGPVVVHSSHGDYICDMDGKVINTIEVNHKLSPSYTHFDVQENREHYNTPDETEFDILDVGLTLGGVNFPPSDTFRNDVARMAL